MKTCKLPALSKTAIAVALAIATAVPAGAYANVGDTATGKPKLRENSYYYGAFNRRDPFRSLVSGKFVRQDRMTLIELSAVELVGVVQGELDRFAMLEDDKGFNYILRVGDRVRGGTVVSIGDQTLVARVTNFGQTSKFTLHLVDRKQGDKR